MGTKFEDLEKNSAKKLTGIGVVVFLHILVGLVLMAGMAKDIIKPAEQPVELMIIQDIKPPEPEPPKETPPEPPKIVEQVPERKPVEKVVPVQKTLPTPSQPTTVAVPTPVAASPSPSPVAAPAPVVAAAPAPTPPPAGVTRGVAQGEAGCKRPDYPRDALMNDEQGEVLISVYVNTAGKVQDAKVKKSSGSRSLDRAASKAFSLCTFKPAMKDGEPQESWYDIPYEFVLD